MRVFLAVSLFAIPCAARAGWEQLPDLPEPPGVAAPAEPRLLPVAAAQGDTVYLFGGAALEVRKGKPARRYLRDAWSYTGANGWKRLADLPKSCVAAASPAPVASGMVFLIAGDDGSLAGFTPLEKHTGFPQTMLCYNIAANSWTATGDVPAPRATAPCVEWQDGFVSPGAEVRPGVRSPDVWSFREGGRAERRRDGGTERKREGDGNTK